MKLLIVDDEVIIRTGLASVIAWNELGLTLLAPAASAEEALKRIREEKPDILMTDIRMSGKNGLQLAEEAKRMLPALEVIILSGYGDFAYTQQAIRQGVGDYLLKTSKPEEIIKTVLQAKQRIAERRAEDSRALRLAREERQRLLLKWIVEGEPLAGDVFAAGDAETGGRRAAKQADRWQVLLLCADGWGTNGAAGGLLRFAVQNMLEDLIPGAAVLIYREFIVCAVPLTAGEPSGVQRFKGAFERIEGLLKCRLRVAAGETVAGEEQAHRSYVTAAAAFRYHDLLPGTMFDYADLAGRKGGKTVLTQEEETALGMILLDHDRMTLRAWTQELADTLAADPECTPESFRACLHSAAAIGHRWLERTLRAVGREEQVRIEPWPQEQPEDGRLKDELFRHLLGIMNMYHTSLGGSQMSHVQRAKAYMASCPAEALSLQRVAAYVHLHPGHLSELFKKETGSTFGDFVTGMRMRRAMNLLAVTPAKVSEVAAMTGYEDVKYFSRLFRKHTGKTPSEFREEALDGGLLYGEA
ncbi:MULTISPECIES: helix-turn-helix domain-containing protein [unclassified Paenibacillus]|uniref:helix-turn-helix domain-containing protein n=1 Tax=unclassified Paenibacillus TaxID=185978 RepID=UPI0030F9906E